MGISKYNTSGCLDLTAKAAIDNVIREEKKTRKQTIVRITTAIPPTVNHAYITTRKNKRILTAEAKDWMEQAGKEAFLAMNRDGWEYNIHDKLIMELWAFWPDKRRRDIHNLHKLVADAFEGILYKDDRMLLMRDMDFSVDRKQPRVEIVIKIA